MAFRGRGRGRGQGGMGGGYVKQEPYILFPEDVTLPDINGVTEEKMLVYWNNRLQNYWKSSSYYLEEAALAKSEDNEIERYSDRGKPRGRAKRDPLTYHLKLTPAYFPRELIQGARCVQHDQRKARWNPESGLQKLDMLEKLEAKYGDKDEKGEKEKKEGENEEEEEEEVEVEEEDFSDDDYLKNDDFDDDEDEYNMDDGGDDGPTY